MSPKNPSVIIQKSKDMVKIDPDKRIEDLKTLHDQIKRATEKIIVNKSYNKDATLDSDFKQRIARTTMFLNYKLT